MRSSGGDPIVVVVPSHLGDPRLFSIRLYPATVNVALCSQRHRLVNETLADELKSGVHALSMVTKTPDQWKDDDAPAAVVESSPKCRGGFGK